MACGIAIVCLVALCGYLLVGCSGDGGKIVLRVADWGGAGDDSRQAQIERSIYAEFEREHPNVEIQREGTPGSDDYVQKMLLCFVAHSEPDVIRLDASSAAVFIDNGVLKDLTPFVDSTPGFRLSDYYSNTVDVARRGSAVSAIPVDFTPLVMYYNRRLFDRDHVPYPKPGWTWDDFLRTAKRLTHGDQYGFTFDNWMPGWLPLAWNDGADVFDTNRRAEGTADGPKMVEAVTFLRDLVDKYRVAPSLSHQAAEGAQPFENATAAMQISGHWDLTALASAPKIDLDEIGVVPLPVAHRGAKPVTVIYESGWSIGKSCRHADLAWEFIRYFTSRETQRRLQTTGIGVCARKDVSAERASTDREREFLRIIPSGRLPWGSKVEGYSYVESEGQKMMDAVLKDGRDPYEALHGFAQDVDRELGRQ